MTETTQKHLKKLYKTLKLLKKYEHAVALMNFDFETAAPPCARDDENDTINFFANESFRISNSKATKETIVYLYEHKDELEELDKALIDGLYDEYLKTKNVTPSVQLKWLKVYGRAYTDWLAAKKAGKFRYFKKSLAAVVAAAREEINLRENALPDFYDNLLNDCEKGMLKAELDGFFGELKVGLIDLIAKIKSSKQVIRRDFLSRKVPVYKQAEFSDYVLKLNGYDFDKGYLTTTEHPFTMDISRYDARVTTHYYEDMFLSNIYSVVHEGGHAIFMQNERAEDYEHFINDRITNGMHESVSRFYENVIGRSEEYIGLIYPQLKRVFSEELKDVSERELYEAVNIVEPSLIRTEADEVTYGLHIVIRYEMEKALCSGKLKVEDVPAEWNRLYKEYLGVTPKTDAEGVLQDVHWTSGFGYFPSYALGNAYNAMYLKKISEDMDFKGAIRRGDFAAINEWMKERVFKKANVLTPKEWLKDITGESLSAKPFIDYLTEKYSKIYCF